MSMADEQEGLLAERRADAETGGPTRPPSSTTRRRRRINGLLLSGACLFLTISLVVLIGPSFVTWDPDDLDYALILTAPGPEHVLGTDALGRDLLARLLHGGRTSLLIGASVMALTAFVGTVLGLITGVSNRLDSALMRLMDVLMAFPALLLALAVLAALGNTAANVVLALSLVYIPRTARIVRGEVLVLRELAYVEAAEALGASQARILFRHILPGVLPALIVQETFLFAYAILGEAGLSFVGVGIQPPSASWGNILGEARSSFQHAPWLVVYPGLFVALTVLSLNLLGDSLGHIIDPKRKTK